jgi:hypothetical protein
MMDTRGPPVKLSPEPIYSVAGNEGDMWPFFPGVIKIGNLKKITSLLSMTARVKM